MVEKPRTVVGSGSDRKSVLCVMNHRVLAARRVKRWTLRESVHTAGVLTIGEFSRLTHLSVRTLRKYHEATLLEPAVVDETTGYRYYAVDQIPTAQVIHRLRELDVPLGDVQQILRSPEPGVRAALVADHLQRLEADLDRTRAAVASLRRLLRPDPARSR